MQRLLSAFLIAAVLGHVAPAAAIDPEPAIDGCIKKLLASEDPVSIDQPLEELSLVCPQLDDLGASLDQRTFTPVEGDLSLADLLDLRHSLRSYTPIVVVHPMDLTILPAIVKATLKVEAENRLTWWERFKRWLREQLKVRSDPNWFNWLEHITVPKWVGEALLRVSVVLILVLALATVLNEMRAVPWRWRGWHRKGNLGEIPAAAKLPKTWEDIAALPRRAQGAALFHWVLERLAVRRLAREQAAHTHREHACTIAAGVPLIADPIHELAVAAERGIYAPSEPSAIEVEQWRDTARAIESALGEAKA